MTVSFHSLIDDTLKVRIVKMSRLLSQVWLEEEEGKKFMEIITGKKQPSHAEYKDDIVKAALAECGIDFPENFVKFKIDTSTFNGSIEFDEDLSRGLVFVWKLPFAPKPASGITDEEIKAWIELSDNWEPSQDLPKPDNVYIPLATF